MQTLTLSTLRGFADASNEMEDLNMIGIDALFDC